MSTATLFTSQTPTAFGTDGAPGLDLGTTFWLDADGSCIGCQIYYGSNVPIGAVASIYVKDNPTAIATSAAVSSGTPNAYNTVSFASPVALTANTAYVAAYHTAAYYCLTTGIFDSQLDSSGIHGAASGSDPVGVSGETLRNGLVGSGSSPAYPSGDSGAHSCYFVGPVIDTSTPDPDPDPDPEPDVPTGSGSGGWWSYLAIVTEGDQAAADELARPPIACPNDGEPLRSGPNGVLHCTYDGYEWPRDGRPY